MVSLSVALGVGFENVDTVHFSLVLPSMDIFRELNEQDDNGEKSTSLSFNIIAGIIFVLVSFCFFFPCNRFIPLDRRSASIMGATMCYATRSFGFPHNKIDIVDSVDFDVLALLTGIMAINFIMVHQKESKRVIRYVQTQVRNHPRSGFWIVSFAAFIISPFLTNDGVCLLFVEPILNAFETIDDDPPKNSDFRLTKGDSFYFLIALACSSNIGSALTYTGNPQNMIVGGDAIAVMSPILFLFYMTLPSISSFLLTMLWVERSWMKWRATVIDPEKLALVPAVPQLSNQNMNPRSHSKKDSNPLALSINTDFQPEDRQYTGLLSPYRADSIQGLASPAPTAPVPVSQKLIRFIITPFPYAMLLLMAIMIALLFVDLISIFGLICLTAVFMVVVLVLGNHWQGLPIWGTATSNHLYEGEEADGSAAHKMTSEEKIENTQQFFEELFQSLDYNLLFIFLGLFVVVENIDSTGIPRKIWKAIVGKAPFDTPLSVTSISIFILIASQFLGNVPVIQLAKPNVEMLDDDEKRYAWAILSFVATVGGNLTITGSAANIIVAEKAARIDPSAKIDFFRHYEICFWITLVSCTLGAFFITGVITCYNQM